MKTTVIIPTGPAHIQCLKLSLLSLLEQADLSQIDKIIVSINGVDPRSGDTSLQDQKESFCRLLQSQGYPVEPIRVWSRVGFGQPIQMALPLVETDNYLLMHDDLIVLDNSWQKEMRDSFSAGFSAVISRPVLPMKLTTTVYDAAKATTIFYPPNINNSFSAFKKDAVKWSEYFFKADCDNISLNEFFIHHPKAYTLLAGDNYEANLAKKTRMIFCDRKIERFATEALHYGLGSWFIMDVLEGRKRIATFSRTQHHLEAMSWKDTATWEATHPDPTTREVISSLRSSASLEEIASAPDVSDIRPLVCVIVYNRTDTITHWINAWKKARQFGGKLLIVQNFDNNEACQKVTRCIQELKPDYHWLRPNDGDSALHWFELADDKFKIDYDWNVLCAFCDDCLPLKKDFLWPFLNGIVEPNVGLVGGGWDGRERGVCLAMKKSALQAISSKLNVYQMKIDQGRHFPVKMEDDIKKYMAECGYNYAPSKYKWPLIFGWDCDHQGICDLWEKLDANFNVGRNEEYLL